MHALVCFGVKAILGGHNKCRLMIALTRTSFLKVAVLGRRLRGRVRGAGTKANHAADSVGGGNFRRRNYCHHDEPQLLCRGIAQDHDDLELRKV